MNKGGRDSTLGTSHFQACQLNHSCISPILVANISNTSKHSDIQINFNFYKLNGVRLNLYIWYKLVLFSSGEVPEWLNGAVSKTVVPLAEPRVRISPSPHDLVKIIFI